MFTFKLDGREIPASPGQSVLEAALEAGVFIPHLCHHKDLPDIGGCGLCVVETGGKTVRACLTEAKPGMEVVSKSDKLAHIRSTAMQLMLAGHIDDCNSCPKYLKCEFQMLIQYHGVTVGDLRGTARGLSADTGNPLIVRDMERCIACGRCVRVCKSVRKVGALTYKDDEKQRKQVVTKGDSLRASDCRFCGACVEVCPTGALRDKEGVFAESFCKGAMLVPCSYECPAHLEIPEYIRFIRSGDTASAHAKIMERAPFPRSLGNICMRFCESKCRRQYIDEPVAICSLKRFAGMKPVKFTPAESNGKRVAVIGAGPAGLTAAWLLRLKGYAVTVLEKNAEPGGMMRYGMPEYRLGLDELKADIDDILSAGIELRCGMEVSSPEQLADFDALLFCVGAQKGVRLPLAGSDAEGVYTGLDFLKQLRCGEKPEIGKKTVVLGGGDVAWDCARSAVRLGAESSVCCLEDYEKMTCSEHERTDGSAEGVSILDGRSFERIVTENGRVTGLETMRVSSFGMIDGKFVVEKVPDSQELIPCDSVIFAVGQRVALPEGFDLPVGRNGAAADIALGGKYFAAGDSISSTSSVVQAVASAQKAAAEVDVFLGGDGKIIPALAPKQEKDPCILENLYFNAERMTGEELVPIERIKSFAPYISPLGADDAEKQASRCLQCDLRKDISRPRLYSEFAFKREVRDE